MVLAIIAQAAGGNQSGPLNYLVFPLILGAMYFFMIRPQRRAREQHMQLVRSIQVGDEIETASGIFGRVRRLDDNTVWLDIASGVTIKMSRAAVRRKVIPTNGHGSEG
ncbi:MAG: preprotein translocase subunit YajC [Actinomycetota bacterium]